MRMLDLMILGDNHIFFYFFLLILLGCSSSDRRLLVKSTGEAQGSYYHIQYLSENNIDYKNQIDSILLEIDSSLSIYREYSLIYKLNKGSVIRTDSFFNTVYYAAKKVYLESEGNFDCTVSPLMKYWGFYKDMSQKTSVKDSLFFKGMSDYIGFNKINFIEDSLFIPKGMSLDFNAIAQGYTVDIISRFLDQKGCLDYLVEVGGEVLAKGKNADGKTWKVGIDKPVNDIDYQDRFMLILNLDNKALATSGNYRNFYERDGVKYSHVMNPLTCLPSRNKLLSVSVVHESCMFADAYATAFMVMGLNKSKVFLENNSSIEAYFIYTNDVGDWETFISSSLKDMVVN